MCKEPRFQIGQKYTAGGKRNDLCTITDILKTYNSNNELCAVVYVSTHTFMGQTVTRKDCDTTIAMHQVI